MAHEEDLRHLVARAHGQLVVDLPLRILQPRRSAGAPQPRSPRGEARRDARGHEANISRYRSGSSALSIPGLGGNS